MFSQRRCSRGPEDLGKVTLTTGNSCPCSGAPEAATPGAAGRLLEGTVSLWPAQGCEHLLGAGRRGTTTQFY